jgi:RNA polymerase sigma factor (sigma-70 family)
MEEKQSTFEELCLPHLDAAYSLARLLVRKDEDAQDLVQEAYVRAWKGFKGFRGDNARAWLMMIVRNTAYSWLKKHANEANMVLFDPAIHAATAGEPRIESCREERVQPSRRTPTSKLKRRKCSIHTWPLPPCMESGDGSRQLVCAGPNASLLGKAP